MQLLFCHLGSYHILEQSYYKSAAQNPDPLSIYTRPTAILPEQSKLVDREAFNQLLDFLEANELLAPRKVTAATEDIMHAIEESKVVILSEPIIPEWRGNVPFVMQMRKLFDTAYPLFAARVRGVGGEEKGSTQQHLRLAVSNVTNICISNLYSTYIYIMFDTVVTHEYMYMYRYIHKL